MKPEETFAITLPLGYICVSLEDYTKLVSEHAASNESASNLRSEKAKYYCELRDAEAELDGYRRFFAQDSYSKGKYEDFIHYGAKPIDPVEKEGSF